LTIVPIVSAIQFSVVITCHNQAPFIREAVDSALAQGYESKQIIVVDDASSDDSPEILKSYGDRIQFAALQTNHGASTARNLGAAMSTGKYLVFLDGDDVLLSWALEVYDHLAHFRHPKIILSRMRWFDAATPLAPQENYPHEIQFAEYDFLVNKDRNYQPGASALVIERETFRSVKGWTDKFFGVEDVDLMLKLGSSGLTVHILAPETKGYRIHASNTRHRTPKMVDGLFQVIARENAGIYPGGPGLRFGRYVMIGAPVLFWFKAAWRARLFRTASSILARGWKMFAAAAARRIGSALGRRNPPNTLPINPEDRQNRALQQPASELKSYVP
jgi:glycosyltransferase involved in cell wall biosynthesis